METFGLMQLLNTLLPKAPMEGENAEGRQTEIPPVEPPPLDAPTKNNACVDFFAKHEQRANRRPAPKR